MGSQQDIPSRDKSERERAQFYVLLQLALNQTGDNGLEGFY